MEKINESDLKILEKIYIQQGFVEVCKVEHIKTGKILCLKKIYVNDVKTASTYQSESIIMASLSHPNIAKLLASGLGGHGSSIEYVYILSEFYSEGDLDKFILNQRKLNTYLPEETILDYLWQIVSALKCMHDQNIAHRDIKPQNIFLTNNGKVLKLGDFGSATMNSSSQYRTLTGTPLYLSPVLRSNLSNGHLLGVNHDILKSDIYSLGLTLLYLASLTPVNDLACLTDLQSKIEARVGSLPAQYQNLKGILIKMLDTNESFRFSLDEIQKELQRCQGGVLNISYYSENKVNLFVKNLFGTCVICANQENEENLFVLNAGLLCKKCFYLRNKFLKKFEMTHLNGNYSHPAQFNEDLNVFDCECGFKFCSICKVEHLNWLESCSMQRKSLQRLMNRLGFLCRECSGNLFVWDYDQSHFMCCENDHYYCVVCLSLFNENDHRLCKFLFMGWVFK